MYAPPLPNLSTANLPILQAAAAAFKLWYQYLPHTPRLLRYSLGEKITSLATQLIEQILIAGYSNRNNKIEAIYKASATLDLLKYFLQIAFDLDAINNKQFASLAAHLAEVGRQLGGWQKQASKQTPPP